MKVSVPLAPKMTGNTGWSCRLAPTSGASCTSARPCAASVAAGPTPECTAGPQAPHRRLEVGVVGAVALAVLVGDVAQPGALIGGAVVLGAIAQARPPGRRHEGARERAHIAVRCDDHRSIATARLRSIVTDPALLRTKHRRHVLPAPSGRSRGHPTVEIGGMAPLVHLRIPVGRSAQHLAARSEYASTADRRLRLAFEGPVERAAEQLRERRRNRHVPVRWLAASLDQ